MWQKGTGMFDAEIEKKKAYLKEYRKARIDEQNYLLEIEAIYSCRVMPKQIVTGMPGGHTISDLSDIYVLTEEKWQEYIKLRSHAAKRAADIMDCINQMQDATQKSALLKRYIQLDNKLNYKSWEKIADELGYSASRIFEIYNAALQNFPCR